MKFTLIAYSRLKNRLQQKYQKNLAATFKELKTLDSSPVKTWLIHHRDEFKEYSALKWYLLQQIQMYLWFFSAQEELSPNAAEFTHIDDLVFEQWNKSEFAGSFLKVLNKGNSVKYASQKTLTSLEHHLVILGERHLLKHNVQHKNYQLQPSLGDVSKAKKISKLLETTLHIDGKELNLLSHSLKEMKHFSQRIEVALKVIKKFSPSSWERFKNFTETIIPIKQSEFVSFSHQELPGYSMINLYNRDFVDLMDDLIHENGHHHLNYYLNLGKVIDEPTENIYYSPWRRTLRPLRGIYHAYFTFYWAFELFSSMARAKELDSIFYLFNSKEKEKIFWRAVEEFWMLEYTYQDLKWAKGSGLISEKGWDLIRQQKKYINKFKKIIPMWEKKIGHHRSDLNNLKKSLKEANRIYKK